MEINLIPFNGRRMRMKRFLLLIEPIAILTIGRMIDYYRGYFGDYQC